MSPASLDAGTSSGGGKTDVKIDDSSAKMMVKYGNPEENALISDPSGLGLYGNLTRHAKSQPS